MPKLKEIDINYEQIRDLFSQLDFGKKITLIKEVVKDKKYRENFYAYTEGLAKQYKMPQMSENELDVFLHKNN